MKKPGRHRRPKPGSPFARTLNEFLGDVPYRAVCWRPLRLSASQLTRWMDPQDPGSPDNSDLNKLAVAIALAGEGVGYSRGEFRESSVLQIRQNEGRIPLNASCTADIAVRLLHSTGKVIGPDEIIVPKPSDPPLSEIVRRSAGALDSPSVWWSRCGIRGDRLKQLTRPGYSHRNPSAAEVQRIATAICIINSLEPKTPIADQARDFDSMTCSWVAGAIISLLLLAGFSEEASELLGTNSSARVFENRAWRKLSGSLTRQQATMTIGYVPSLMIRRDESSDSPNPVGLAARIATEVALRITGREPRWQVLEWAMLEESLIRCEVDVIAPMAVRYLPRARSMAFSEPMRFLHCGVNAVYSASHHSLVRTSASIHWQSLCIEYDPATVGSYAARSLPPDSYAVTKKLINASNIEKLREDYTTNPTTDDGRVRCFFNGQLICYELIAGSNDRLMPLFPIHQSPRNFPYVFLFGQHEHRIRKMINLALKELYDDIDLVESLYNVDSLPDELRNGLREAGILHRGAVEKHLARLKKANPLTHTDNEAGG